MYTQGLPHIPSNFAPLMKRTVQPFAQESSKASKIKAAKGPSKDP